MLRLDRRPRSFRTRCTPCDRCSALRYIVSEPRWDRPPHIPRILHTTASQVAAYLVDPDKSSASQAMHGSLLSCVRLASNYRKYMERSAQKQEVLDFVVGLGGNRSWHDEKEAGCFPSLLRCFVDFIRVRRSVGPACLGTSSSKLDHYVYSVICSIHLPMPLGPRSTVRSPRQNHSDRFSPLNRFNPLTANLFQQHQTFGLAHPSCS